MIKIDRGTIPASVNIYFVKDAKKDDGTPITKAEKEELAAIAFHTDDTNYKNEEKLVKRGFSFRIYKDKDLAIALEAIFKKKCAYCESRFPHVMPKEIEHFRPKGEIVDGKKELRPGYYWLAGDWDNLLVACIHCNRAQKHEVPGQPRKVKLGKQAQFPLSDQKKRIRKKGDLSREEAVRLLINPCIDEPEKYFTFDDRGLIYPLDPSPNSRATVSIAVYALQRKDLVEERLRTIEDFKLKVNQLDKQAVTLHYLIDSKAPAALIQQNTEQLDALSDAVKRMLAPDAPYLGMLRDWIRRNHKSGELKNLKRLKIDLMALV